MKINSIKSVQNILISHTWLEIYLNSSWILTQELNEMREPVQVGSLHGLQELVRARVRFGRFDQVEVEHAHEVRQLLGVGVAPLQELVAAHHVVGQARRALVPVKAT